ncbi:Aste57867_25 [Aphanomyces stellatus]|uniref:Aste57867_25 protein n=1 Tax=Aphanomyces stellatus TaxID=120398 RepID=A0A485K1J4_9STRA|nr:hypothetical protein As57867_000025 [Aphanomyces stellatus]VFT77251.1 Aste57867_25 [Aphanomyces stellatus]
MPPTAAAVLHSPALLLIVCSFQQGITKAIQSVLHCSTVQGIYGRLIVREDTSVDTSSTPSGDGKGVLVYMDALPAFMDHRREILATILNRPRAVADMHAMLATHSHMRDVVAEYAAFYGDAGLMEVICENAKEILPWFAVDVDPVTQYSHVRVRSHATHLFHLAAFHGHAAILTLLGMSQLNNSHRRGSSWSYSDLEVAAERGHLPCVQIALDNSGAGFFSGTYWGLRNLIYHQNERAATRGDKHLNLVDAVASDGNVELVNLLCRQGAPYSRAAIDNAATNGHLTLVEFFHAKQDSECTTQAMDGAAANGYLEVVQFLHDHRNEGCTTDAMDVAARHGHDTVVRFLLAKRAEGGTVKAMNAYVTRGDLAMVKLLAMGKCWASSVNLAASLGQLEIVKYLVGHKEIAFAAPAIEAAVQNGHINVVAYLHGQRAETCVAKFMQKAHGTNQLVIVEYFDSHRCKCCQDIPRDELLVAKPAKKRRRKN